MFAELAVDRVSRDYKRYVRKMGIIKNQMDRAQARREAREEGLAEGLEEGENRKALEIARKMKKAGRPIDEIIEFTGISIKCIEQSDSV